MKTRIVLMAALILLGQEILSPFLTPEAMADTRITITFAAGGAACGIYYFFRFTFRSSLAMEPFRDDTAALANYGPGGWLLDYPSLKFVRDEQLRIIGPGNAPEIALMELLRLRF
jgi:hypothetical protein